MANIPIDESPNLSLDMESFTDKTPVHYDEMNGRHKQHLNNEKALLYPSFDDSGTVSSISSFSDFLGTVKNRMRIFDFFKNFKAGMQFVMHLGRAANNCTTTAEGLYLDARQGKVLMDLFTKLNSDIAALNTTRILTLTQESSSTFFYRHIQARETALGIHFDLWLEAKNALAKGEWFITYMSDVQKTIAYVTIPIGVSEARSALMYQTTAGCFNLRLHQDVPAGTAFYSSVFLPI